jgi:hypothetical protein
MPRSSAAGYFTGLPAKRFLHQWVGIVSFLFLNLKRLKLNGDWDVYWQVRRKELAQYAI